VRFDPDAVLRTCLVMAAGFLLGTLFGRAIASAVLARHGISGP
jgi:hypothetical protein